jgi:hypothetical protein
MDNDATSCRRKSSCRNLLDREAEAFRKEKAIVIVLSEAGYRIHRRGELTK